MCLCNSVEAPFVFALLFAPLTTTEQRARVWLKVGEFDVLVHAQAEWVTFVWYFFYLVDSSPLLPINMVEHENISLAAAALNMKELFLLFFFARKHFITTSLLISFHLFFSFLQHRVLP